MSIKIVAFYEKPKLGTISNPFIVVTTHVRGRGAKCTANWFFVQSINILIIERNYIIFLKKLYRNIVFSEELSRIKFLRRFESLPWLWFTFSALVPKFSAYFAKILFKLLFIEFFVLPIKTKALLNCLLIF